MNKDQSPIFFSSNDAGMQLESVEAVRIQLANAVIVTSAVISVFALAAAIFRAKFFGDQGDMFFHIFNFVAALGVLFFYRPMPYRLKASLIPGILFLAGTFGLLRWGLVGLGIPCLITCCILIAIFFGGRSGLVAFAASLCVVALTGIGVQLGRISFNFDIHAYAISPFSWVIASVGFCYLLGLIMTILIRLHSSLINIISKLNQRTSALAKNTQQLEEEISERKRILEELKKSEEKYRDLVEDINDVIYTIDSSGLQTYISPVCEKIHGYKPEELIGFSVDKIVHPDDMERVNETFLRIARDKKSPPIELRIITKNGDIKWIRVHSKPILQGRQFMGIKGVMSDISERRRAEEELRKLASVVKYSSELVNLATLDGKMIFLNKAGSKMLGIEPEEVEKTHILEVIPDHLFDLVLKELLPNLMENHTWEGDLQYRNLKTGELVDVHAMTFTIQDPSTGRPLYLANVSLDITERKRTQQFIIQTEKMLSVGGLAAGMAHEINNPLAGILQNAQVMKNRISNKLLPKNKQTAEECGTTIEAVEAYMNKRGIFSIIDAVMDSGKRAARIVDNMLSFSRKGAEQFTRNDLADLLDKTVELAEKDYDLKKKYDFRHIEIVREYDPSLPQVMCEGSKIQQVFLNILKNGAHAMYENKEQKEAPRFLLRIINESNTACIEIGDNGPGMDETTRKRVFEPFFTTKSAGAGTGQGLSISYFIITESHGGMIGVESTPGRGTKFIIRIPIERNAQ